MQNTFVVMWTWADDDQTIITHKDRPEVKGVVRGHNHPCGTLVAPATDKEAEDGESDRTSSDIKGWVPARAVDQAMGQQMIMTIAGLSAYLAKSA